MDLDSAPFRIQSAFPSYIFCAESYTTHFRSLGGASRIRWENLLCTVGEIARWSVH